MLENDTLFSTPMMVQYQQLKEQYQDCLLLFRLGDFFELFLEDAEIGARVLGITLTSRSRGKDGRIPMAGVPYHAVDSYIVKLVQAGYKVALCDQVTAATGKTLVDRQIVRVITPGTVLSPQYLHAKKANYVLAIHHDKEALGLAAIDITTGEFLVSRIMHQPLFPALPHLHDVITQLEPMECLVPSKFFQQNEVQEILKRYPSLTVFVQDSWKNTVATAVKQSHLPQPHILDPWANQGTLAALNLISYLEFTQKKPVTHLRPPQELLSASHVHLDRSTIANLELTTTLGGEAHGSLLSVLDKTATPMGGRLLRHWILQPLQNLAAITDRLAAVEVLTQQRSLAQETHDHLRKIGDLERLLSRLSLGIGTPKDVVQLAESLAASCQTLETLKKQKKLPPTLVPSTELDPAKILDLIAAIKKTIVEEPPVDPRQGGVIKAGINARLDELNHVLHDRRSWLLEFETAERQKTGISSLKVRYNQVFGYYIEISKANLHLAPAEYDRKQTLVNAERFMTPELKKQEEVILTAEAESTELEFELFQTLLKTILEHQSQLQMLASFIATLDCLHSLAQVAQDHNYVKPSLNTNGDIKIIQSRHPVVEQILGQDRFMANDITLTTTSPQLIMLTGPNMAGKSVLMRQVALVTLLAHMGSFVPAQSADISLTDRIFVRSGAADRITAGLSTFMVEMVETAYILRHATPQSLIIMDEIGRGTSTYDGISIAWAIAEFLVQDVTLNPDHPGPKTLFATHYHELQELATRYPNRIANFHMAITLHQGKPVFLYTLTPGGASHSFGVAVAAMAGLPYQVIHRSEELLADLETSSVRQPVENLVVETLPTQLALPIDSPPLPQPILELLKNLSIENTTPLQALTLLAELKQKSLNHG